MVSTRKRISFHIAAFLLAITPVAAAIGNKSLVPVFVLSTIAMIIGSFERSESVLRRISFSAAPHLVFGVIAAILVLAFSFFDMIRSNPNADDAFQFAIMLILLLCWPLFNPKLTNVAVWFVPAFIVTFVIALVYVQLHMWTKIDLFSIFHSKDKFEALFVFNHAVVAVVLLSWIFVPPASAALRPMLGLLVVLIAWVLSFFTQSEAAIIGMAFGLSIYLSARFITKQVSTLVIFGTAFVLLAAPWLFGFLSQILLANATVGGELGMGSQAFGLTIPASFAERAEAWQAIQHRIFEAPSLINGLIGHGADFLKQNHFVVADAKFNLSETGIIHPHNIFVQAWLDGGLIIVIALLCLVAMIGLMLRNVGTHAAFAAIGLMSCAVFVALVSHSLFSDWWFANLALSGIIFKVFNENLGG